MSVQNEINRINGNIADTYDGLEVLGATMPEVENSDNLASTVATISEKESISNKKDTITGNESSSVYYPSTKAVYDYHDSTKENISNKTNTPGENYSTTKYPSVKGLRDYVGYFHQSTNGAAPTASTIFDSVLSEDKGTGILYSHFTKYSEPTNYTSITAYSDYVSDESITISDNGNKLEFRGYGSYSIDYCVKYSKTITVGGTYWISVLPEINSTMMSGQTDISWIDNGVVKSHGIYSYGDKFQSVINIDANSNFEVTISFMQEAWGYLKVGLCKIDSNVQKLIHNIYSDPFEIGHNETKAARAIYSGWNPLETMSNKSISIASSSTDNEYPSAKAVYDFVQSSIINAIEGSY